MESPLINRFSLTRQAKLRTLIGILFASSLFAVLAYFVTRGDTHSVDTAVLVWINQFASINNDTFFKYFTELGGVMVLSIVSVLLVALLLIKKQFKTAAFFAVCIGGVTVLNLILKSLFDRARPDLWEWIVTETHLSFPSGHATATMTVALAIIVLLWNTQWRLTTIALASVYVLAIGVSRLYLGVHFPTDILGGWLLGIIWVSIVLLAFASIGKRTTEKTIEA